MNNFAERRDADLISKLSKSDMLEFVDEYLAVDSPKRSKVAVHMRGQKFTSEAANDLFKVALDHQVDLPEELKASLKDNPSLTSALESLEAHLKTIEIKPEAAKTLKASIRDLITPPEKAGVTYVDKSWRSTLQLGPAAEPAEHFEVVA
jgi:hypothetical protein